jgi:hypothetical protein
MHRSAAGTRRARPSEHLVGQQEGHVERESDHRCARDAAGKSRSHPTHSREQCRQECDVGDVSWKGGHGRQRAPRVGQEPTDQASRPGEPGNRGDRTDQHPNETGPAPERRKHRQEGREKRPDPENPLDAQKDSVVP